MRIVIRRVGNSRGMIIPASLLAQVGLESEADVSVEDGALIVRPPAKSARAGWADAAKALAAAGDDKLVLPDLANEDDVELQW